jgi:hypothetical protein
MSKFLFNGTSKTITMRDDSVVNGICAFTVSELWSEWCDWLLLDDNLKYLPALDVLMVPLTDTESVGPYLFMRNDLGWIGIPPAINPCTVMVNGSFFGKDPNSAVMKNLEAQATDLIINRSVLTNTVVTSGVAGPTAESIAAATVSALVSNPAFFAQVAADVLSAATVTPINANVKAVADSTISGAGTEANPWRP